MDHLRRLTMWLRHRVSGDEKREAEERRARATEAQIQKREREAEAMARRREVLRRDVRGTLVRLGSQDQRK